MGNNEHLFKPSQEPEDDESFRSCQYITGPKGISIRRQVAGQIITERLTNFGAEVITDIIVDDGLATTRKCEIEATLNSRKSRFVVSGEEFKSLSWVHSKLGPKATISARNLAAQHLLAAIQSFSQNCKELRQYGHTGWVHIKGHGRFYLHAGGAIGGSLAASKAQPTPERPCSNLSAPQDLNGCGPSGPVLETNGPDSYLRAALPSSLADFRFPKPTLSKATLVAQTLKFLELGPAQTAYPLFASIWRAFLGGTRFGIHLAGPTGTFKSERAALAQQFSGPTMNATNLKGHWHGTPISLEALCYTLKDSLVVVDDFAPSGTKGDIQRLNQTAERLFRAKGNSGGRSRSTSTGSFQTGRPPRAFIVSTGEDVPIGHSLRARFLCLQCGPDDINPHLLSECQEIARAGIFAQTAYAFIEWLAPQHDELLAEYRELNTEWRASHTHGHRRVVDMMFDLAFGFLLFKRFAEESDALSEENADALMSKCLAVLDELTLTQQQHVEMGDPVEHFKYLLTALFASRSAHLACRLGFPVPEQHPESWGYRSRILVLPRHPLGAADETSEVQYKEKETWTPMGVQIGWVDYTKIYLIPEIAFAEIQKLANRNGTPLPMTLATLEKRLHERGLLLPDQKRKRLRRRETIDGVRRNVLVLPIEGIQWLTAYGPHPEDDEDFYDLLNDDLLA